MQRLYSMFPTAGPGVGLALLRVAVAVWLLSDVRLDAATAWPVRVTAALIGVGLATPVLAAGSAVSILVVAMRSPTIDSTRIAIGLSATALALLGPGAYSLDARIFGRRRVVTTRDAG